MLANDTRGDSGMVPGPQYDPQYLHRASRLHHQHQHQHYHQQSSSVRRSPHKRCDSDSLSIESSHGHGSNLMSPERSLSTSSPCMHSYSRHVVQPRTSCHQLPPIHQSPQERNTSTFSSSSTIHPTIANLITPTRALPTPNASSTARSFLRAFSSTVVNFISTKPEPGHEVQARDICGKHTHSMHYSPHRQPKQLRHKQDSATEETIEEISDEPESIAMDQCEPQRGWSISSSHQTSSPSPLMASADSPQNDSKSDPPSNSTYDPYRQHYRPQSCPRPQSRHHDCAQPPSNHHNFIKEPQRFSVLLPPTNIPGQEVSMDIEPHKSVYSNVTEISNNNISQYHQLPQYVSPASSTTLAVIKPPPDNIMLVVNDRHKQSRRHLRAMTMPVRPSHYEHMSVAQKRLYDLHPRSPEYDDESGEDDNEDEGNEEERSEPASPATFSSISRSPSPSRRILMGPHRRSLTLDQNRQEVIGSSDEILSNEHHTQPQEHKRPRSHHEGQQPRQYHHQQQRNHPYHYPHAVPRRNTSFGSPISYSFQEKALSLDPYSNHTEPRHNSHSHSQPQTQKQQQQQQQQQQQYLHILLQPRTPQANSRRQHRPHQLLHQSLHAAGSMDSYSYSAAPLTGSSVSSTGSSSSSFSSSCLSNVSPTESHFFRKGSHSAESPLSPSFPMGVTSGSGSQMGAGIPHLPGTERMSVLKNEDGSIMVYNPMTDSTTFRCELCPLESFGRIHDLKRHQTSKHQEMTWPCDFCHRPFVRRDALLRHYTVKAARDDGVHPARHEVEKLLEARARAKMLY